MSARPPADPTPKQPTSEDGSQPRPRGLARLVPRGRFARRLALLSGGTLLGQGLIVLSSPLLTRLFTPDEFGTFAVFSTFSGVLMMVSALRYEFAIPFCKDEAEAATMTRIAALAGVVMALLVFVVVQLFGDDIARLTGTPGLADVLWLLAPTVLVAGMSLPLNYWSIRRGTFRVNAKSGVARAATQATGQLAAGLVGAGSTGLVVGYALGYPVALAVYLRALPGEERRLLLDARWREMLRLARTHWHYPVYSMPSSLFQASSQLMPSVLFAVLYGPAAAGWFALGQRVMGLPVRLLGQATSQVFLGEITGRDPAFLYRLFVRTALRFFLVGALGCVPLVFFGPQLFALVFGENWRIAGNMLQLLVPLHLARFVVLPISQTLNAYSRQDVHLLSSGLNVACLIGTFVLAGWRDLPVLTAVALYSGLSTLSYLLYFGLTWRIAVLAARSPTRGEVSSFPPADRVL